MADNDADTPYLSSLPKELTKGMRKKHILFACYYFQNDNATEAAVLSGHSKTSARTQGYRLLKRDDVQSLAQWLGEHAVQEAGLTPSYVIANLQAVVEQGTTLLPIKGPGGVETGQVKMSDASSAVRALELLGRYMQMWQGDVNVDAKTQVAVLGGTGMDEAGWQDMVSKYILQGGKATEAN